MGSPLPRVHLIIVPVYHVQDLALTTRNLVSMVNSELPALRERVKGRGSGPAKSKFHSKVLCARSAQSTVPLLFVLIFVVVRCGKLFILKICVLDRFDLRFP